MSAGVGRTALSKTQRIVVKVGTGVVADQDGQPSMERLTSLVQQIDVLRRAGKEVLLVSSGAIGVGAVRLGLQPHPTAVVDRQACAAAGQAALVGLYASLFEPLGLTACQVLLTEDDFRSRRRYLNLAATLQRLLNLGAVPIINENDTVSTAELALQGATVFGDNDRLSALLASNLGADLLVLLTNVDGLYTAPPDEEQAQRIATWQTQDVRLGSVSAGGRGGMEAKIEAAQVAVRSGVHVVIANGQKPQTLQRVLDGEDCGTWFPAGEGLNKRRQWLAFATTPAGSLVVNEGARSAMVQRKASLLPPGVVGLQGSFEAGAVVSIVTESGEEFARGICGRASREILPQSGTGERNRALVHRDHVVIFSEEQ